MKTTNKFLALAIMAAATVFASCSKDDECAINNAPTQQEIETKITAKFTIANVTIENADPDNKTDVYEVDFTDNDIMGVHVLTGAYPNFTYDPMNLMYAVSDNGKSLTAKESPIELTDKEVSILAYYPYKIPYDPAYELKVFSVQTDPVAV